jgi:3-isopropylmalate dehydrogenase
MSPRRTYVVACLAGHGIGPEVMAEASRALSEVSRLHGFRVDEVHPPFAGEAVPRSGHPLPAATRNAVLAADAALVSWAMEPALEGVTAELDLAASVTRTLLADGSDITVFAPLAEGRGEWAIERALASAGARTGTLVSVGVENGWRALVEHAAEEHHVGLRHLTLAQAAHALADDPDSLDVVVTERVIAQTLADLPRIAGSRNLTATGLVPSAGPGLFGPAHGSALGIAGQGVANPTEMLLAVALMLGEGLGRREAAVTLENGLAAALARPVRTADMSGSGLAATTREFVDVVLDLLPSARRDTEFAIGGAR